MSSKADKEEADEEGQLGKDGAISEEEVEELRGELEQEKQKVEETLSKMKYLQADFDNYQKRMNREIGQLLQTGSEKLILKLLGILDDFERAIEAHNKEGGNTGVLDGIMMIRDGIKDLLREEGIKEIETADKRFDPTFHEAVSFREIPNVEDGTILSEVRKGYLLHEKVIRTSMVEVARKVRIVDVDESEVPVD